jgi:penicillin-binding protein 2
LFLTLLFRFFILQIMRGGDYRKDQVRSSQRTERLAARRGKVLDRNGNVLAENVETYDLMLYPARVKDPDAVAEKLRQLLWLNDEEDAHLRELIRIGIENKRRYGEVTIRRDLISDYCPDGLAKLDDLNEPITVLWSRQNGKSYRRVEAEETRCPHDRERRLKWNRHGTGAVCSDGVEYVSGTSDPEDGSILVQRSFTSQCPTNGRWYNNERAIVEAHLYEIPGVKVKRGLRRVYPYGRLLAHVVGYMNQVTRADIDKAEDGAYRPGDRIGRTGIEKVLETELRGTWGTRNVLRDRLAPGQPANERSDPDRPDVPVSDGLTARLSIDIELQRMVKRAMRWHRSGAAVVVNVPRGEVLAMYSKPTFDPNAWSGRLSREEFRSVQRNPYSPMLNKAITAYAPGSVYKLITATAGIVEERTDFRRIVGCRGFYEYGGRKFRCHNRHGHGDLDLVHAMSRSCDIFFYRLGEELGMDELHAYASKYFGLGQLTGVELPESDGLSPTKRWHRDHGGWMPGFTISTAVGQKDVRASPLQIARAYVGFAGQGELKTVHVLKQLEDTDGNALRVVRPTIEATLPLTEDERAALAEGFWRAVNDEHGTAFQARLDGVEVAGKTGTAEAAESKPGVEPDIAKWFKQDHAWFAGYAPARAPEVVVVVFLEHGTSGGKAAAPVAMRIFKDYFSLRDPAEVNVEPLPNPIRSNRPPPSRTSSDTQPETEASENNSPIDLE